MSELREISYEGKTFRYGNKVDVALYPDIEKLTPQQVRDLVQFMEPSKLVSAEDLLDEPFATPREGRFTDGSYGVYSTALERETARIEAHDFFVWLIEQGYIASRFAYYRCISAMFSGKVMDLVGLSASLPYLTAKDGIEQCRDLAAKARRRGIDGFLTDSAARARRGEAGTCLPVFNRATLSAAKEEGDGEKFTI